MSILRPGRQPISRASHALGEGMNCDNVADLHVRFRRAELHCKQ